MTIFAALPRVIPEVDTTYQPTILSPKQYFNNIFIESIKELRNTYEVGEAGESINVALDAGNCLTEAFQALRNVDGIDELATAGGSLAPGIAAPIITTIALSACLPFVAIAAKAAINDANNQWAQYKDLECPSNIDKVERNASVLSAAAMTGMTGGVVLATASSAAGIASMLGNVAASGWEAGLSIAAGGVFLPSQFAMMAYGQAQAALAEEALHQLAQNKNVLENAKNNGDISNSLASKLNDFLEKKIEDRKHQKTYGNKTAAGQGFMMLGNMATLSGIGAPMVIPSYLVGVPLTLGSAIHHIIHDKQEKNFKGEGATPFIKTLADKTCSLDEVLLKHAGEDVLKTMEKHFKHAQGLVAHNKLLSLMAHVLRIEKKSSGQSPEACAQAREDYLNHLLKTGKRNRWKMKPWSRKGIPVFRKKTTLLKDEVRLMSQLWEKLPKNEKNIFLYGKQDEARMQIKEALMDKSLSGSSKMLKLQIDQSKTDNKFLRYRFLQKMIEAFYVLPGVSTTLLGDVQRFVDNQGKNVRGFRGDSAGAVPATTLPNNVVNAMTGRFTDRQKLLAQAKLFSLMHHVLLTEKPSIKMRAEARENTLKNMLTTGKKSRWKGTTLLRSEIKLMSQLWEKLPKNEKNIFLYGKTHEVMAWMSNALPSSELSSRRKNEILKQQIRQDKTDSQYLRYTAAQEMIKALHHDDVKLPNNVVAASSKDSGIKPACENGDPIIRHDEWEAEDDLNRQETRLAIEKTKAKIAAARQEFFRDLNAPSLVI